jgi:hypothetical protein
MSDTGAPWNLPYPLPTDLVRDGADAIKDLAEAVADGLDAAGNPGIGSNVVSATKTDTFSTSSTSFTNVTGLSVTITPSSATAKVLLIAQVMFTATPTAGAEVAAIRIDGGNAANYVGDADGSRARAVSTNYAVTGDLAPRSSAFGTTAVLLDSPTSGSPVTYNVQIRRLRGSAAVFVNRTQEDTNADFIGRFASSITAIEVAA